LERPYLLLFPLIGAIPSLGLQKSAKQQEDLAPFNYVLVFLAAFTMLAGSSWPSMILPLAKEVRAEVRDAMIHFTAPPNIADGGKEGGARSFVEDASTNSEHVHYATKLTSALSLTVGIVVLWNSG
jgi:hypothetical protein